MFERVVNDLNSHAPGKRGGKLFAAQPTARITQQPLHCFFFINKIPQRFWPSCMRCVYQEKTPLRSAENFLIKFFCSVTM